MNRRERIIIDTVLVKLLSGVQAGAEFVLPPGSYAIGSGDDVDLVLADALLRPRHALVTIGEAWEIEPLDGAEVRVDGRVIPGKVAIAPFQVATLGGIHLAFGPEGKKWDKLPAIPRPAEEQAEPAPAPAPATAAAPASPPPQAPAASAPTAVQPENRTSSGCLWVVLAVLLLAAAAGAAYWFLTRPPDPMAVAVERLRSAGIKAVHPATGRLPVDVVGLVSRSDGVVEAEGLLTSRDRADAARRALDGVDGAIMERFTFVDDEVAAGAGAIAGRHPDLRLEQDANRFGTRLTGMVNRAEDASAALKIAREAMDRRIPLRNEVLIWPEVRRAAERAGTAVGMTGLKFEQRDGEYRFVADPWPDDDMLENWQERVATLSGQAAADFLDGITEKSAEAWRKAEAERLAAAQAEEAAKPRPGIAEFDLDTYFINRALEPLPVIQVDDRDVWTAGSQAAAAPAAEPPPEPEQPEPEQQPDETPEPPPPAPDVKRSWQVARVTPEGFVDQQQTEYRIGDFLDAKTRLAATWPGGAVLQRDKETVFVTLGNSVEEQE